MNRQSTRTWLLLLERTQAERDSATAALRRAEDAAARQQTQAAQLQTYRVEYQQRWSVHFGREGRPEILQCYRNFMDRLDQAVQQQDQLVVQAAAAAAEARRTLQAREQRVAAVRKLIERRLAEQQAQVAQREQRHSDETAQRSASRSLTLSGLAAH
jgi:flagellar protein FliJ